MIILNVQGRVAEAGSLHLLLTPLLRQYDSVKGSTPLAWYLNVTEVQHKYPVQP